MQQNERIVLWGDSLGKGVIWNAERARYAQIENSAACIIERRLGCSINNRSKFGCTAPMGLEILKKDIAKQISCDAAVLEYGGNDCNFDWASIATSPDAQHDPNTLPSQFADTLRTMAVTLRDAGIRPVLMTLPPIHPERYFRFLVGDKLNADNILRWLGDVWQIYRFQEMYSLMIVDVARELGIRVLDLRARCLQIPSFIRDYLCEDGLHLNGRGQEFAGEQLSQLALAE